MTSETPAPPEYTPQARAERLIALGRLILAGFSLLAVYVEPSTPRPENQQLAYTLLAAYTSYALLTVIVAWRRPVPRRTQRLVSHVAELILFTIFVFLTEGPASPFFVYFVFSLFCATMRFRWRGIVATGAAATVIYSGLTIFAVWVGDPDVHWSRFGIRIAYLIVITLLLSYLGFYQEHLRTELAALAAWPREVAVGIEETLRRALSHVSAVMKAPRVLFVWEENEEPWVYAAMSTDGNLRFERVAPGHFDLPEMPRAAFLVRHSTTHAVLLEDARGSVSETDIDPAGAVLREHFQIGTAVGATLASESVNGRLFALDIESPTSDDLLLAQIVGNLLLASLEQFFFLRQVTQNASAEERLRIARDLHDGAIQSLSGVGLQLQSIRSAIAGDDALIERIAHIQRVVEGEQRELRNVVRELRPMDMSGDGAAELEARLRHIRERYLLEWAMSVNIEEPLPATLSAATALEAYRIVNESLANAARHGRASHADVVVAVEGDRIRIRVADDGKGFSFTGRLDLHDLHRAGVGPKTLKERIANLGGTLVIESTSNGATLEAVFPLRRQETS